MARLGTARTLVVSGEDGLGDVTLAATTNVTEVTSLPLHRGEGRGEGFRDFQWQPEDFGIPRRSLDGVAVDGPAESAALIRRILGGEPGPAREIVILNAAAGLITVGKATEPKVAADEAAAAIDSGAAKDLLVSLAERSHQPAP